MLLLGGVGVLAGGEAGGYLGGVHGLRVRGGLLRGGEGVGEAADLHGGGGEGADAVGDGLVMQILALGDEGPTDEDVSRYARMTLAGISVTQ